VLQDVNKLVAVMKNGVFHREPAAPRPAADVRPMNDRHPVGEGALVHP
jgi:hypothetical protein